MTQVDSTADMRPARPKSLTARSLLRRAALGLAIVFASTLAAAWLYHTTIDANASGGQDTAGTVISSDRAGPQN